ncbi:hypothetical protein TARUN_4703 [Trichoderma arundinaceum]|uniref:Uncharacterized protein n=1 Tax=Trichoderma arundinaceum TaxID=490622 RepID=A0A395NNB4_TRIAR|nr:hypothetical protein TARUN_4703 [Trichoderma arundinaceum]
MGQQMAASGQRAKAARGRALEGREQATAGWRCRCCAVLANQVDGFGFAAAFGGPSAIERSDLAANQWSSNEYGRRRYACTRGQLEQWMALNFRLTGGDEPLKSQPGKGNTEGAIGAPVRPKVNAMRASCFLFLFFYRPSREEERSQIALHSSPSNTRCCISKVTMAADAAALLRTPALEDAWADAAET